MKAKSLMLHLLAAAALLAACSREESPGKVLYSELKSVNKIVLAQMTISKMATIDDLDLAKAEGLRQTGEALLDAVKIGNRKAAYSYNTYLRAYIDMSELTPDDIDIDPSSKTITISLPAIQTEFAGRDPAIREDHYRVTWLRSEINPGERAEMKEKMNTALKKEVEGNSAFKRRVIETARAKGEAYFRSLAALDGYSVTVNFKGGSL